MIDDAVLKLLTPEERQGPIVVMAITEEEAAALLREPETIEHLPTSERLTALLRGIDEALTEIGYRKA
jgi:hypothetical protein